MDNETFELPHLCIARDEYYRIEGMLAFSVKRYYRTKRNQHATVYIFLDGSRLAVGRNRVSYRGTDGKIYAVRLKAFAMAVGDLTRSEELRRDRQVVSG